MIDANSIKSKYISALNEKEKIVRNVLEGIMERNKSLKSSPEIYVDEFKSLSSLTRNEIRQFLELDKMLSKLQKESDHLTYAESKLDKSIKEAEEMLKERKIEKKRSYISMFSPTAWKEINKHKKNVITCNFYEREITNFKNQLKAIAEIKEGCVPRQRRGLSSINLDELIMNTKRKLEEQEAIREQTTKKFSGIFSNFLSEADRLLDKHDSYANAFSNFQNSYIECSNRINSMLQEAILKNVLVSLKELYTSLKKEKEIITSSIEKINPCDDQLKELRRELKIRTLHLEHITAVTERSIASLPSNFSKNTEFIKDPIEDMKNEIAKARSNR